LPEPPFGFSTTMRCMYVPVLPKNIMSRCNLYTGWPRRKPRDEF
jgi:hypothetical protein